MLFPFFFFFKQKTAYEITYGDWSSDVCSSDLGGWRKKAESQDLSDLPLKTSAKARSGDLRRRLSPLRRRGSEDRRHRLRPLCRGGPRRAEDAAGQTWGKDTHESGGRAGLHHRRPG